MNQNLLTQSITVLVCIQPLFLLSVKGWGNGVLIIASLLSLALIIARKMNPAEQRKEWARDEIWFMAAFLMPLLATLLSAILRKDYHWAQFDSPSKFLLAILVYIAIRNSSGSINKYFELTIPIGVLTAFIYQAINLGLPPDPSIRANTHFMDAIMFGYISLSLGLMALYTAGSLQIEHKYTMALNLVAGLMGLYLSFLSQSRTGWLAIIFVTLLYAVQIEKSKLVKIRPILFLSIVLIATVLLPLHQNIKSRLEQVVSEVADYSFKGMAPDTSIGLRITYWRIAMEMISKKPLSGYGDTARTPPEFPKAAQTYSSDYVKDTIFKVGFHNELMAASIRSGIPGAISIIGIFLIPLFIFLRKINSTSPKRRKSAALGAVLILVVSISSLTIETFGLKFAASYYACMLAAMAVNVFRSNDPLESKLVAI